MKKIELKANRWSQFWYAIVIKDKMNGKDRV